MNYEDRDKGGRPLLYPEFEDAMSTYSVKLTAKHARIARKISEKGNNLSEGIRKALEAFFNQVAQPEFKTC